MNDAIHLIGLIMAIVTGYFVGKDAGYREALGKITDGTIHLSIWVKKEDLHTKILEMNNPVELSKP